MVSKTFKFELSAYLATVPCTLHFTYYVNSIQSLHFRFDIYCRSFSQPSCRLRCDWMCWRIRKRLD